MANAGLDLAKTEALSSTAPSRSSRLPRASCTIAYANPTLQFILGQAYPKGSYDLKVVMVTQAGKTVDEYTLDVRLGGIRLGAGRSSTSP